MRSLKTCSQLITVSHKHHDDWPNASAQGLSHLVPKSSKIGRSKQPKLCMTQTLVLSRISFTTCFMSIFTCIKKNTDPCSFYGRNHESQNHDPPLAFDQKNMLFFWYLGLILNQRSHPHPSTPTPAPVSFPGPFEAESSGAADGVPGAWSAGRVVCWSRLFLVEKT